MGAMRGGAALLAAVIATMFAAPAFGQAGGIIELTSSNFVQAAKMPVTWLIHVDDGASPLGAAATTAIATVARHYNVLATDRGVRVGRANVRLHTELRPYVCDTSVTATCSPLVAFKAGQKRAYRGGASVEEIKGFAESISGGGAARGQAAGRQAQAQAQTAAQAQAAAGQQASAGVAASQVGQGSVGQTPQVRHPSRQKVYGSKGQRGGPREVELDRDRDGRADAVLEDRQGDGTYELLHEDIDGDGTMDLVHEDTTGDGRCASRRRYHQSPCPAILRRAVNRYASRTP